MQHKRELSTEEKIDLITKATGYKLYEQCIAEYGNNVFLGKPNNSIKAFEISHKTNNTQLHENFSNYAHGSTTAQAVDNLFEKLKRHAVKCNVQKYESLFVQINEDTEHIYYGLSDDEKSLKDLTSQQQYNI